MTLIAWIENFKMLTGQTCPSNERFFIWSSFAAIFHSLWWVPLWTIFCYILGAAFVKIFNIDPKYKWWLILAVLGFQWIYIFYIRIVLIYAYRNTNVYRVDSSQVLALNPEYTIPGNLQSQKGHGVYAFYSRENNKLAYYREFDIPVDLLRK